ncbi:hypothetical protein BaRGS_00017823, partial [Batillaria attramentaria]
SSCDVISRQPVDLPEVLVRGTHLSETEHYGGRKQGGVQRLTDLKAPGWLGAQCADTISRTVCLLPICRATRTKPTVSLIADGHWAEKDTEEA